MECKGNMWFESCLRSRKLGKHQGNTAECVSMHIISIYTVHTFAESWTRFQMCQTRQGELGTRYGEAMFKDS